MEPRTREQIQAMSTDELIEVDRQFQAEVDAETSHVQRHRLGVHRTLIQVALYHRAWDGDAKAELYRRSIEGE